MLSFAVEKLRRCEIRAVSISTVFTVRGWTVLLQSVVTAGRIKFYKIFRRYFITTIWHAVAQLVEGLRVKPEGCEFNSQSCHWEFFSYLHQYYFMAENSLGKS